HRLQSVGYPLVLGKCAASISEINVILLLIASLGRPWKIHRPKSVPPPLPSGISPVELRTFLRGHNSHARATSCPLLRRSMDHTRHRVAHRSIRNQTGRANSNALLANHPGPRVRAGGAPDGARSLAFGGVQPALRPTLINRWLHRSSADDRWSRDCYLGTLLSWPQLERPSDDQKRSRARAHRP